MKYSIDPGIARALQIKKNTVVEAMQFKRGEFDKLEKFTNGKATNLTIEKRIGGKCTCIIEFESGASRLVKENEYVVKGNDEILHIIDRGLFEIAYRKIN